MICHFCGGYITLGQYCNDVCQKNHLLTRQKETGVSKVWKFTDHKCNRYFCDNNKANKYCNHMWGLCGAEQSIRLTKGELIFRHSLACNLLSAKVSEKGEKGLCPQCLSVVIAGIDYTQSVCVENIGDKSQC